MKILFVDEDYVRLWAWISDLEYRGHEVIPVRDADEAFETLTTAKELPDWVIVDVMLAASPLQTSKFDASRTDGGLETGIVLVKDLSVHCGELFRPNPRITLLTNTTNAPTYAAARRLANELAIKLLDKNAIASPTEFGDIIEQIVGGIYNNGNH